MDISKGIAIMGVLIAHSFIVYPVNIQALPWCQHALGIISTFYLVTFFVVSGYLSFPRGKSLKDILVSRTKRLLIPYAFYAILNYLVKVCAPSLVNNKVESFSSYLADVFLYGGELWFLYTLFLISVFWSIILPIIKNKYNVLFLALTLFFIDSLIDHEPRFNIFLYTYFIHYSGFFLIGYFLRSLDSLRPLLQNSKVFFVVLILFIMIDCLFVENLLQMPPLRILCKILGILFIWMFSFQLLYNSYYLKKAFSWCGKNSLGLYWLNGYCLVIARTVIVSVMHLYNSVFISLGIFLLTLLLEVVSIIVIKKLPFARLVIGV